jgi:HPt (histidine-containing phosphotransfer) domain-containing protein
MSDIEHSPADRVLSAEDERVLDKLNCPSAIPASAADPARRVLDPELIGRLVRLGDAAGEDLLVQLAGLFARDAGVRVAEMREALAQDDADAVARSAHMLSGASANLGAVELARLCAAFETAGVGDVTADTVALDAIEAEFDRVRLALLAQAGSS